MALMHCPECSEQVSRSAQACPKCGHPFQSARTPKKKTSKLKVILLIAVAIGVAGTLASRDGKDASTQGTSTSTGGESPSLPGIGDTVSFDDSEWVVLEARNLGQSLSSNTQFHDDAETSGAFIQVHFQVTNRTNEEERVISTPKLLDAQEREFSDFDGQGFFIPEGGETLIAEALPADLPREYYSIFEVPANATGLRFQARSLDVAFRDYVEIDLGLDASQ